MLTQSDTGIPTLESLREHLQFAIGLELATIPVYLSGLYSIHPGQNTASQRLIQSVVIEEMLHMALAANVLNAIGGVPSTDAIDGHSPVVNYPGEIYFLPGLGTVNLRRFSPEALETFKAVEQPALPDQSLPVGGGYASIGTFYQAIVDKLRELDDQVYVDGAASRGHCQIGPEEFYGASGTLFKVTDRDEAVRAVEQIVNQGEGIPAALTAERASEHGVVATFLPADPVIDGQTQPDGWKMYSHFARFKEIASGRRYRPDQRIDEDPLGDVVPVDWSAVYPMVDNPGAHSYPQHPDVEAAMASFNDTYTNLVDDIYAAFNGHPGEPGELRGPVTHMWTLKYQALELMKLPVPTSPDDSQAFSDRTVGPPFVYQG